ncbi:clpP/crotonase-like domain, Enoyl-CoA hydratase/isomerase, HIBYL-CoA-H type [Artemisia annua]|uniref:3-hydroxyisobutyryl-CoA hydrolase n=1 Tax=Artemisia annua TaxID=35608 RepID=A0A2U1NMF6_ARTAN|nr:clpP/crotonase-like domain, Enoyl-CoA hydratase/isomerase, HIBYL-CoA-H type [Artemisia annua]
MLEMFKVYENDPTIKFVILKGTGKAFCAGGDVTALFSVTSAGHWSFGANFFRKQYSLDYLLGTYKKPMIALMHGIVMGGGAGLSMNAAFRIVTENTLFAMPEASIGSVPDVGASYFLSRLPGYFGEYVALTGVRLNGLEMVDCGLATHYVPSKDLTALENALSIMSSSDAMNITRISEIVMKHANGRNIKQENACSSARLEIINKCFSKETVEDILLSLENFAVTNPEKWILQAIKSMKSASPLCIKLALKLIREGRSLKLEQCLSREHLVVSHLLRRTVNDDFYEGPRAMLVDKDKNPQWSPSKLELVNAEMVRKCFAMIDDEDWEPMQLSPRDNYNRVLISRI